MIVDVKLVILALKEINKMLSLFPVTANNNSN